MSNTMKEALDKAGIKGTKNTGDNTTVKKSTGSKTKARKVPPAPSNVSASMHGTVKWFDFHKGYGFIVADDGSEHFVYHTNITSGRIYTGFETGDEVTFRTALDVKNNKTRAVNVQIVVDEKNNEVTSNEDETAAE